MPTKKDKRSTMVENFCFTANNPEQTPQMVLAKAMLEGSKVKYICFGEEVGKSGTFHFQGFLQSEEPVRFSRWMWFFGDHIEGQKSGVTKKAGRWNYIWSNRYTKSTNTQARDYTRKDCLLPESKTEYDPNLLMEKWHEWGKFNPGHQGQRTDHMDLGEMVLAGATPEDILDAKPMMFIKYHAGIREACNMILQRSVPQHREVYVTVLWGESRGGKTYAAQQRGLARGGYFFLHGYKLKEGGWMCGYRGEKTLILDDWEPNMCSCGQLKMILDNPTQELRVKNSHTYAQWDEVILTTNIDWPHMIYTGVPQKSRQALFNRVDKLVEFTKNWKEQTPPQWSQDNESEVYNTAEDNPNVMTAEEYNALDDVPDPRELENMDTEIPTFAESETLLDDFEFDFDL